MRCADPAAHDERQGVVVLEEELSRRVEAHREAPVLGEQPARALGDRVHGLVPVVASELALAADERLRQAVG